MNYRFDDISEDDVVLIGAALDALPHGKVQALVAKMQVQISAQDHAEQERVTAERKAQLDAWRAGELAKLRQEIAASKPVPPAPGRRKASEK